MTDGSCFQFLAFFFDGAPLEELLVKLDLVLGFLWAIGACVIVTKKLTRTTYSKSITNPTDFTGS